MIAVQDGLDTDCNNHDKKENTEALADYKFGVPGNLSQACATITRTSRGNQTGLKVSIS